MTKGSPDYKKARNYQRGARRPSITKGDLVTLGGKAKNAAERDLVGKLVNDVKGVKSVKNQMTIEESK